ncbi:hypothetical protein LJB42_003689 [Komagataella kurtzmanii]|nr:hypothetical protein LJB42_003689 [Komagataella kurtzmanii]
MVPVLEKPLFPQALSSSFASRTRNGETGIFISAAAPRSTKRNTAVVNYAEFERDFEEDDKDEDFYDDLVDISLMANRSNYSNSHINVSSNFQGKEAVPTVGTTFSDQQILYNSSLPELVIPIKINIEYNGNKIQDCFLWNINETLITPESFATIFCNDMELPNSCIQQIETQINNQIEEFSPFVTLQFPKDGVDSKHCVIQVSVNIGKQLYEDQIEWDLNNDSYSPEQFAHDVVSDMGLAPEFKPAISVAIHEQLLKLKKEYVENPQLNIFQQHNLPRYNQCYQKQPNIYDVSSDYQGLRYDKDAGEKWTPRVEFLSQWEIEKREIERERNIRRMKRESMRHGEDRNKRRATRRKYDDDGLRL